MIKVLVVCLGLCFIMFSSSLAFVRQVRTYHASALEAIAKTKSLQSVSVAEATVLQLETVEEAAVKKKGKRKAPEGSRYTEAVSLAHQSADGIYIRVKGEPLSLARHRNSRFGGMYNPSAKIQKNFRDVCLPFLPKTPYEVPLEANLKFYFSRPKNHFRTGKNSHILRDGIGKWHEGKSDLDNLVKFVLDALNKVAYVDDSQIAVLTTAKVYTDEDPCIELSLKPLKADDALPDGSFQGH